MNVVSLEDISTALFLISYKYNIMADARQQRH
jgi:hypothetical protein